jgi:hypothetical protein
VPTSPPDGPPPPPERQGPPEEPDAVARRPYGSVTLPRPPGALPEQPAPPPASRHAAPDRDAGWLLRRAGIPLLSIAALRAARRTGGRR